MSVEGVLCTRCNGQGWWYDPWVNSRIDCNTCNRTGMIRTAKTPAAGSLHAEEQQP